MLNRTTSILVGVALILIVGITVHLDVQSKRAARAAQQSSQGSN